MVANHQGGRHQGGITCGSKSALVLGTSLAPLYQCWRFSTLRVRPGERAPDVLRRRQRKDAAARSLLRKLTAIQIWFPCSGSYTDARRYRISPRAG
jgi:hypothetical protein